MAKAVNPKKSTSEQKIKKVPAKKSEKTAKKTKTVSVKEKKSKKQAPETPSQVPSVEKQEIINKFQVKEGDTGSPEVQVALLTKRIEKLVTHLKANPSDNHSRRGLLGIVSKRRRLLNYLEKKDQKRYKGIIEKLDLNK